MNITQFIFPEVTRLDIAFGNSNVPEGLLELAKEKGFYNGNTKANDLFSKWFFSGLDTAPEYKEGIDKEKAQKAMNWACCFMRSFEPKHEEKEAICAFIFDECLKLQ
jgi:hypothetical protein